MKPGKKKPAKAAKATARAPGKAPRAPAREEAKEADPLEVRDARFAAEARELAQLPGPVLPELAFAGRSNVGKSSLMNMLVRRRRLVRVSGTPGCTRGINLFHVELARGELTLVDLPGYGYAKRSKKERGAWGDLIERYLEGRATLRAVVVIVDVRHGATEDDLAMLEFLAHIGRPALLVATKLDKLPVSKRKVALAALREETGVPVFGTSSETGEGRERLARALLRHAFPED